MPHELAAPGIWPRRRSNWRDACTQVAFAWLALGLLTWAEWREMAHQWWDIDTYNHVLLVPAVLGWLVWLRRDQLMRIAPAGWWPGLVWMTAGLTLWLGGRGAEVNLAAQIGTIVAFQGAAAALISLRAAIMLAFPLFYALFLVPFGDELIPALQGVTARIAIALTHLSGVPASVDGLFIDTPAGRFVVAEECAGVKFLIAMVALAVLVAWTGFTRWQRRVLFVMGAAVTSILANGVRAWGTIYVAQYVGAERAGGFDHIVYGWIFFGVVLAAVLAAAWRWFERDPVEAGMTADEVGALTVVRFECLRITAATALAIIVATALAFAAIAPLV